MAHGILRILLHDKTFWCRHLFSKNYGKCLLFFSDLKKNMFFF